MTSTQEIPQEALVVEMSYEDWMDLCFKVSALAYEIQDLKEAIAELDKSDEGFEEKQKELAALEGQYEALLKEVDEADPPAPPEEDEEGDQFDFGESAADW